MSEANGQLMDYIQIIVYTYLWSKQMKSVYKIFSIHACPNAVHCKCAIFCMKLVQYY